MLYEENYSSYNPNNNATYLRYIEKVDENVSHIPCLSINGLEKYKLHVCTGIRVSL